MDETPTLALVPGPGPDASGRAVDFHRRYAALVRSGAADRELVELVFEHCHTMVFAIANRITGSAWEAEDITQSVFERFVRQLHDVRDPSRIPGFLKTCVVRTAMRQEKRGRWRRARAAAVLGGDEARTRTNEELMAASVRTLLERLEPDERTAVVLKYIELYGHEDVAALMGVSVSTARRRIESGRRKLAALVGEAKIDELLSGVRGGP